MEVWSGTITTSSSTRCLDGIRLIDPSSTNRCDISKAKLSIDSLVDPTLIPLFALTGPVLEVHISSATTGEWITDKLLRSIRPDSTDDADEEESCTTKQCPAGILLALEHSHSNVNVLRRITDILIYGIISSCGSTTPPKHGSSSSPAKELRIYAAPICSGLIAKAHSLPSPQLTPSDSTRRDSTEPPEYAEFLFDPFAPSPKRKRVETLFEAADEYHKRVQRKGMIAVSEYIEKNREASPALQFPYLKVKKEHQNHTAANGSLSSNAGKQRAGSIGSRNSSLSRQLSTVSRPLSKNIPNRKPTPSPLIPKNEVFKTSAGGLSAEDIISTNKALLTRTILTCLRLYGYNRNTHTARTKSEASTSVTDSTTVSSSIIDSLSLAAEAEEEDEFKAMYHATYRASMFALRVYLNLKSPVLATRSGAGPSSTKSVEESPASVPVLNKERATDVVDSLLKLFCGEPG
ncbi:hypothetical protein PRK78_007471 [Emydomyces testavorans]|uniref:Sld7 C-terminal domain-containing protein n=1 Tax=Emydomyces testavorans TaxID=2070801 RepID=A0AAF0DRH2_9EURO|nr:hypothetical protein PRK78_007471 [Emydomyces testavorans]